MDSDPRRPGGQEGQEGGAVADGAVHVVDLDAPGLDEHFDGSGEEVTVAGGDLAAQREARGSHPVEVAQDEQGDTLNRGRRGWSGRDEPRWGARLRLSAVGGEVGQRCTRGRVCVARFIRKVSTEGTVGSRSEAHGLLDLG